jgi:hypothetical protein
MKKLILLLAACQTTTIPKPPEVVVIEPIVTSDIEEIVKANGCQKISFKDKGRPPLGYVIGMAKTYAQTKCDAKLVEKLTRPLGSSSKDALAKYGLSPTLPNLFSLMLGLGLRESSGKHCEGKDMSANFNTAEECEAGAWQTSYNAIGLAEYLKEYVLTPKQMNCFLPEYSKGISCDASNWKYWGNTTSPGYAFQKKAKECPAFHAEFTALVMRENLNHFGPLKRMEAQYYYACRDLFLSVDKVVKCP